jgi:hypothetical protein
MNTEKEITAFLNNFKTKMGIWDVLFRDDRGKNAQTLAVLEIRPVERKAILESLTFKDYSQGPIEEKLYGGSDMWVFGKIIKKKEFYMQPLECTFVRQEFQIDKLLLIVNCIGQRLKAEKNPIIYVQF